MSEMPAGAVPEWTLGDRLRKAREHAQLKQSELADEIGIGRTSVVNYESDRKRPSRPVLLSWALSCGVSLEWLAGDYLRPRGGREVPVIAPPVFIRQYRQRLELVA